MKEGQEIAYDCTRFEVTVNAKDYISGFRDVPTFLECCRQCGNFGRSWACPPFDVDWTEVLSAYESVTIFAMKIDFKEKDIDLRSAEEILQRVRWHNEVDLRRYEELTGGRAFAFAGRCLYCPEGTCSRIEGKPCRHPEFVRPSLEAVGFDISKTLSELFGIELKWGRNGFAPEYFMLVTAVFTGRN